MPTSGSSGESRVHAYRRCRLDLAGIDLVSPTTPAQTEILVTEVFGISAGQSTLKPQELVRQSAQLSPPGVGRVAESAAVSRKS